MAGDNQLLGVRAGQAAPTAVLDGQRPVEVQLAEGQTTFDLGQLGLPIDPARITDVTVRSWRAACSPALPTAVW